MEQRGNAERMKGALGELTLENVLASGDGIEKQLPSKMLYGRPYEEFPDDEIPVCSSCGMPCEWVYFSSAALKKLQGAPVHVCGKCSPEVLNDGGKNWKIYVREGLHEHLSALNGLKSRASAQDSPQDRQLVLAGPSDMKASEAAIAVHESAVKPLSQKPLHDAGSLDTGREDQRHAGLKEMHEGKKKKLVDSKAKFTDDLKIILSRYFITGEGDEFKTSGAEIVRHFRKVWKHYVPHWKVLYDVLTTLGYHCSKETTPSVNGKTKQYTRIVYGLKSAWS